MLRDAALLQLDLVLAGLDEGIGLKDASAYNLQWKGAAPVFVTWRRSTSAPRDSRGWDIGRSARCSSTLFSCKRIAVCRLSRGCAGTSTAWMPRYVSTCSARAIISAGACWRTCICKPRRRRPITARRRDVRADLSKAGFDKRIIKANAERLRALVAGLRWTPKQSTWSDYLKCGHYEASDAAQKRAFVESVAGSRRWNLAWDIGCNVGVFSRIAAAHADSVVAMDADHLAIDKLYQALKSEKVPNILPLIVNVTDPSPNLGWRNISAKRVDERGRPELVLALALIHHVVIGGISRWLNSFSGCATSAASW